MPVRPAYPLSRECSPLRIPPFAKLRNGGIQDRKRSVLDLIVRLLGPRLPWYAAPPRKSIRLRRFFAIFLV